MKRDFAGSDSHCPQVPNRDMVMDVRMLAGGLWEMRLPGVTGSGDRVTICRGCIGNVAALTLTDHAKFRHFDTPGPFITGKLTCDA